MSQAPLFLLPDLLDAACGLSGLRSADIVGESITRPIRIYRDAIVHAARRQGYTLNEIGAAVHRHHATLVSTLAKPADEQLVTSLMSVAVLVAERRQRDFIAKLQEDLR